MKVNSYQVYGSLNMNSLNVENEEHKSREEGLKTVDSFLIESAIQYVICEAINCDEDLCEKVCDVICEVVCDKVCDEWCDGVCEKICDKICDSYGF